MKNANKLRPMGPKEQTSANTQTGILFDMKLRFKLALELTELNAIANLCGITERAVIKDAAVLYMTQTVPFIPDKKTLDEYAQVLKRNYMACNKNVAIHNCVFDGYEYLYAVTPDAARTEPSREQFIEMITNSIANGTLQFVPYRDGAVACQIGKSPVFTFHTKTHDAHAMSLISPNTYKGWVDEGLINLTDLANGICNSLMDMKEKHYAMYEQCLQAMIPTEKENEPCPSANASQKPN